MMMLETVAIAFRYSVWSWRDPNSQQDHYSWHASSSCFGDRNNSRDPRTGIYSEQLDFALFLQEKGVDFGFGFDFGGGVANAAAAVQ
jgi:hypothetical protein